MIAVILLGPFVALVTLQNILQYDYDQHRKSKPTIRTFEPLSPEAIALGKKTYLGPMTAKRRKALQSARLKRKHS